MEYCREREEKKIRHWAIHSKFEESHVTTPLCGRGNGIGDDSDDNESNMLEEYVPN